MSTGVERARADLAAGRAWKARDRLQGVVADCVDADVLDLLATVYSQMGDLPAAGALWFATGREDEATHTCLIAWRERYGGELAQWRSIPRPVRKGVRTDAMLTLERAARRAQDTPRGRGSADTGDGAWWDPVALAVIVAVCALVGIGAWTVLQWIWA